MRKRITRFEKDYDLLNQKFRQEKTEKDEVRQINSELA